MNTLEFFNLFSAPEQINIFSTQVNNAAAHALMCSAFYLAPGQIVTHDNFAAVVNFMNDNSYLDDGSRYATLMASQPATTAVPDIRSIT